MDSVLQQQSGTVPARTVVRLAAQDSHESRDSGSAKPDFFVWDPSTICALLGLALFWIAKVYSTWAAWGDLTIDSGHEMYVPALLAQGKLLYRDAWFMYGPAAPYFNSYLFRLFGTHLSVLYWAGSLSSLGSAIFLYLSGRRLSSSLVGWTAGAVLLAEGFQPSLFCFPLPYSFAAVYGCLVGCVFLWLIVNASLTERGYWMPALGLTAALALLLKPEFGVASYLTLTLLIGVRGFQQRSLKLISKDILWILPGIALCSIVVLWMISIAGVEFITQENIVSWPTSYFMRTYGKMWLESNGFTLTFDAFLAAMNRSIPILGIVVLGFCYFRLKGNGKKNAILRGTLILACVALVSSLWMGLLPAVPRGSALRAIFFPQDMVLYVSIASLIYWWRFMRGREGRSAAVVLVFTFATLLAFRILMGTYPEGYSIYYNGPVVLCFLMLWTVIIPPAFRTRIPTLLGTLVVCSGCLLVTLTSARAAEKRAAKYVPLVTDKGTIRVSKNKAEQYAAAIQFIKERAAAGDSVLSVPEDTSLYFLAGVPCPIRLYSFTPGVLAPGKMTRDTIRELERKRIRYLLWSSRIFPEFGTPIFGKDFDQEVGEYFRSHYRPVRRLVPYSPGVVWDWSAVIWERIPDRELESKH